ncbi:UNVERIFIED_CONTAM: hypothetical protein RMT77_000355 [Armadillidium vulgare]
MLLFLESGSYLALDLGGTNFRVLLIHLENGNIEKEPLFTDEGTKLFDFLANCIQDFMVQRSISRQHYNLGFTFSYPMHQEGINVGILLSWTKSFNCPGVVGVDVVKLLNEAIKRNTDLDITVTCVLNDTTGTLIRGSSYDKRCAIGMILGTGHNGCYLEKVSNIEKWEGEHEEKEVIIDVEWGAFGDNGVLNFLRTEWDNAVDDKSLLKKSFTFEKYIGGRFLGSICQEVLVTLAKKGLFCNGTTPQLEEHEKLKTSFVTKIEKEAFDGDVSYTKEVLSTTFGLEGVTDEDARIAQYVFGIVSYRAVLLVSIISSLLINRMDRHHCTIAVDGSLFENHPRFKPLMEHLIAKFSPGKSFSLLLAKDGSGKGAGLVAAVEDRIRKTKANLTAE